ncbi:MAG: hypothetical protein EHM85_08805 [Desulfobacteraceae bacterium]|nr:MAG: hypothetical protein EHM85_08805 [Desulfobacteraceae bacterium]
MKLTDLGMRLFHKIFFPPIVIIVFLTTTIVAADGSWFIDEQRFHASVHGRNSCQDCHFDISDKTQHPDMSDVNRTVNEFFRPEKCLTCHENISDAMDAGIHGSNKISDRQKYNTCIDCHDPHYQNEISKSSLPVAGAVSAQNCMKCHENRKNLPALSAEDEACMMCHRHIAADQKETKTKRDRLCLSCHLPDASAEKGVTGCPTIDTAAYSASAHRDIACLQCHRRSASFRHKDQLKPDCLECHNPHGISTAHSPHLQVSCRACHLKNGEVVFEKKSRSIVWQKGMPAGFPSDFHSLAASTDKEMMCRRCHFKENTLGASSIILPAPGVICMPCHTATLSIADTTTIAAMIVLILGFLGLGTIWFSRGGKNQKNNRPAFLNRISGFFSAFILEGLFQRRLFRISVSRWVCHGLVFWSLFIRFAFGIAGMIATAWLPDQSYSWILIDKNHPMNAFLFDLTGLTMMMGLACMFIQKKRRVRSCKAIDLPKTDMLAYGLLGGIIIIGFLLEGMRISMTATPDGSTYAFIGYVISRMFAQINVTGFYGYIWYAHAILTGLFIAYLPFSRLVHMIIAPVVLAVNVPTMNPRHVQQAERKGPHGNTRI